MGLPVWVYWEGERPRWIAECYQTILAHATDVRLVTPEIFDNFRVWDRDIDLTPLCIAHRADFIRAFLLAKYGGLYIDSDCIAMKSLQPVLNLLGSYEFIAFRQKQGDISNSFIGAPPGSRIADRYYAKICEILRSGQPIEWLTIGSNALTSAIDETGVPWYEINVHLIQPINWFDQKAFFDVRDASGHQRVLNDSSYCYMLSGNTVNGFVEANPSRDLLEENTFFRFLLNRSKQNVLSQLEYRKDTDDDMWVIPEVINQDMYRIRNVLSGFEPACASYVIDCGAHIGAFSMMCATYFKNVEIVSFEPNRDSFAYLKNNADKFNNIRPVNKAVDIQDGIMNLYSPDQYEWSGRWTSLPNSNNYISVDAVNIFSFIRNLDKPVFILKMDLEGYEEWIFNNSKKEDLEGVRLIIVETHTANFDHERLRTFGFRLLFQPHISSNRQYVYSNNKFINATSTFG